MPSPTLADRSDVRGPASRRPSAGARAVRTGVRALTVLVAIATAAVTLGPRSLVVGGTGFAETLLEQHPRLASLVASLGGVEPAGNLVLFAPLAALLALSVAFRLLPVAFLLLLCSPFAVEWAQQYLPGRVPDGGDIVRNATGLLVTFAVVALLRIAVRTVRWTVR